MAAQLSPQALDQVGMQGESVFGGWLTGERVFLRRLGTLTGVEGGRLGKAVALCVALSRIQLRSQLEVQRANAQRGPTSALRRLRVLFASVAVLRTGQQTRAGRGPIEAVWSWARARGIVASGAFRRVLCLSLSGSLSVVYVRRDWRVSRRTAALQVPYSLLAQSGGRF